MQVLEKLNTINTQFINILHMNKNFLKLVLIDTFLKESSEHREMLLKELKDHGSDPVKRMRRIRMLGQLSEYEASIIRKLDNFDSDDIDDWQSWNQTLCYTLKEITHRSG